jgi:diketogulonate reductase-like aldo/keto reductase
MDEFSRSPLPRKSSGNLDRTDRNATFPLRFLTRRAALAGLIVSGSLAFSRWPAVPAEAIITRTIPSTGEPLPALGLGSWITFNVGNDPELRRECVAVIEAFFRSGGRMIDSSPMYGSSQEVIGHALKTIPASTDLFAADKVWTPSGIDGPSQLEASRAFWGIARFDLLQVHNLLSWENHLPTLLAMKEAGKVRYIGITTSEGRRHAEFERVMKSQPIDFVQLTYNPVDREAEERIFPLAQDRGLAVIANRPFQQGALLERLQPHPLPACSAEIGALSWPQLILKFIISNPAVTCAIPATSKVAHVRENMQALHGPLPDVPMRNSLASYIENL